jgi:hypothetical protein
VEIARPPSVAGSRQCTWVLPQCTRPTPWYAVGTPAIPLHDRGSMYLGPSSLGYLIFACPPFSLIIHPLPHLHSNHPNLPSVVWSQPNFLTAPPSNQTSRLRLSLYCRQYSIPPTLPFARELLLFLLSTLRLASASLACTYTTNARPDPPKDGICRPSLLHTEVSQTHEFRNSDFE